MKGSVFDVFTILAILVVFAIVSAFGYLIIQNLESGLVGGGLIDGTGGEILTDNEQRMPTILDSSFLIIFVLGWIYLLIAGYLLNTNPVFMVVGLIFGLIIIIFVAPIANVYLNISDSEALDGATESFPITNFILSNSVAFFTIMLISVLVATYGGFRTMGGYV